MIAKLPARGGDGWLEKLEVHPLVLAPSRARAGALRARPDAIPDFVGFYRWHVLDPVMFERSLRVTIQQIGYDVFLPGQEARLAAAEAEGRPAGNGLARPKRMPVLAHGIVERRDDYCATSFVVCAEAQPVPRLDLAAALADIGRKPYEIAHPMESLGAAKAWAVAQAERVAGLCAEELRKAWKPPQVLGVIFLFRPAFVARSPQPYFGYTAAAHFVWNPTNPEARCFVEMVAKLLLDG